MKIVKDSIEYIVEVLVPEEAVFNCGNWDIKKFSKDYEAFDFIHEMIMDKRTFKFVINFGIEEMTVKYVRGRKIDY